MHVVVIFLPANEWSRIYEEITSCNLVQYNASHDCGNRVFHYSTCSTLSQIRFHIGIYSRAGVINALIKQRAKFVKNTTGPYAFVVQGVSKRFIRFQYVHVHTLKTDECFWNTLYITTKLGFRFRYKNNSYGTSVQYYTCIPVHVVFSIDNFKFSIIIVSA